MAREWHRGVYAGVPVPVPYYVGEIRDSDPRFPELTKYEVWVGTARGVACANVVDELVQFEHRMQLSTVAMDREVAVGAPPVTGAILSSVLVLCASAHGEWIRIHPFANGNGRTARLWTTWVALRYGLPPFVRIKPRPAGRNYEAAAAASMLGDHTPMVTVLSDMLAERMLNGPRGV
jgi:fido (protein-threonine AMPylation protein)